MEAIERIKQEYLAAEIVNGHKFKRQGLNDYAPGEVDFMALCHDNVDSFGGHNGPECELCGESWCIFCTDAASLTKCAGVKEP